jgi:LuxR family maltose regulon positive regulatory protein
VTTPLLATKIYVPAVRSILVERPRLMERLSEGLRRKLTFISAPAGFGKTTLVASCITGYSMPIAWLSLDKKDNQVGRFLSYLIAALNKADRTIGSNAAQLTTAPRQARSEAVLTSLINDLNSAKTEIVLVLDDFQNINSHDLDFVHLVL